MSKSRCQTPGSLCSWTWGHWFFVVFMPHFYQTKGRSPSTMSEPSRNQMRSKRGGSRSSSQPRSLIPSTPKGVLGTVDPELLGTLACCGFWGWTGCGCGGLDGCWRFVVWRFLDQLEEHKPLTADGMPSPPSRMIGKPMMYDEIIPVSTEIPNWST